MSAFYNELEPYPSEWMRNLIAAGHIAPGVVDERSIVDLQPEDVRGATQAHFFAGIGVWSHALRLAGWPDDRPVWTGSCPCQPFSSAGRGKGLADERHLWPEWFRLIRECRPPVIFGEQVASVGTVGPRVSGARVQEVQDRAAILGVLRELQGQSAMDVHRMREAVLEEEQERQRDEDEGIHEGMEGCSTGIRAGQHSEASCQDTRNGVRAGRSEHPDENRSGSVRIDRDLVRHEDALCLERPVPGSDRSESRVHDEQRPGRSVRRKRDGERLGSNKDPGSRGRNQNAAADALDGLLNEAWGASQEEPERAWIDIVRSDLESIGYTVGVCVLPAAGVGAPHIRQRLYFVAVADVQPRDVHAAQRQPGRGVLDATGRRSAGELADVRGQGLEVRREQPARGELATTERGGEARVLANVPQVGRRQGNAKRPRRGDRALATDQRDRPSDHSEVEPDRSGATRGFWYPAEWIPCRDGKARPVEPGTFPLAHGSAARMGRLRAYGNAICAPLAAEFIRAVMEAIDQAPIARAG